MLDDSGAAVTLVGAEFADHVAGPRHRLPTLRREPWLAGATPRADAEIVEAVANCFLQLYRSGTSGWPEGALLTQHSMTAQAVAVGPVYDMNENTVHVVTMPLRRP
jgi:acyl-CoA synthetase (AMP-forming)/AMP-acid ligase II